MAKIKKEEPKTDQENIFGFDVNELIKESSTLKDVENTNSLVGTQNPGITSDEKLLEEYKKNNEVINVKQLIAEENAHEANQKYEKLKKSLIDFSMEIEQAIHRNGDIVGTKYVLDKLTKIFNDNQ
jgi:methylmalonyl-CoA mutase N-terminal domain/subunit